jgi:hypothetical protein
VIRFAATHGEWHAFWIDVDMDRFRAARLRYNAAFDAHLEIARANTRRSAEGDPPSLDELMLERRAREELDAARRELLAALEPTPSVEA